MFLLLRWQRMHTLKDLVICDLHDHPSLPPALRLDGNDTYVWRGHLARISWAVAVADVFDALTSDRPYRAALSVEEVFSILQHDIGSHFDGECVEALIRAYMAGDVKTQKQREVTQDS